MARATALFNSQGLELPPVPRELARRFRERVKWCFSSRLVSISPYDLDLYVRDGYVYYRALRAVGLATEVRERHAAAA